jgi:glycosyltransferase involved in cell wall biosynthesis
VSRDGAMVSVVAPMLDELALVDEFVARTLTALAAERVELVIVDDGSSDGTAERLDALAAAEPRLRVVHLSRNFGHQAALTAGLEHARGDVVVMMDADLQDPPEVVPTLLERWRAGADVVYAVREARAGESRFKLATASWFYRLFNTLTEVRLEPDSGDFRLLDRRALDALLSMRERSRFLRGMTVWVGFTQTGVHYQRDARYAGETKFTLTRMVRFSIDAISSFSRAPLMLATYVGSLLAAIALLAIPVVLVLRLLGHYQSGFATLTLVVLLLGGIQLLAIGIVGEYLGRIYDEVKQRPLYLVRDDAAIAPPPPVDQPPPGPVNSLDERVGQ